MNYECVGNEDRMRPLSVNPSPKDTTTILSNADSTDAFKTTETDKMDNNDNTTKPSAVSKPTTTTTTQTTTKENGVDSTKSPDKPPVDINQLSYHGIKKMGPFPKATPKCIPISNHERFDSNLRNDCSRTGSPPPTPSAEANNKGYSPLSPLLKMPFSAESNGGGNSKNATNAAKKSANRGIIGVLAAQTLKIASINGLGELDKLEHDLEEEINFENRSSAKTCLGKLRRDGHHHLHSKAVLFIVVLLNIIDCLLVMGELTLDFHHVSHLLQNKKAMVDSFTHEIKDKYSPHLDDTVKKERHVLLQAILDSSIVWPSHIIPSAAGNITGAASQCYNFITSAAKNSNQSFPSFVSSLSTSNWSTSQPLASCFHPLVDKFSSSNDQPIVYKLSSFDRPNEKLITVAHKLHYISVAILSVLVVLLLLKIICAGKRFLRSKMQMFDGVIIFISFVLDLVFIKGVHIFQTNDFVIILTFLLPWRIIRVLNSLIAAVLDKQRLNLKIIYTQKKKISRNLSEVNNKVEVMQRQIQVLQGLCSSRGIADIDVRKILGTEKADKHDKKHNHGHHGGGLASMMALGKLAFQAADALAPMPDVNGRSTPTSPNITPGLDIKFPNTSTATTPTLTADATTANGVSAHPTANGTVPKGGGGGGGGGDGGGNGGGGDRNSSTSNNNNSNNETKKDDGDNAHPFQENPSDSRNNIENSISENLDIPEVSQSLSLDNENESAATISMDLRDDDDDIDDVKFAMNDVSNSLNDINIDLTLENETINSSSHPRMGHDGAYDNAIINDNNATSRL